jgi:hypothetical protein
MSFQSIPGNEIQALDPGKLFREGLGIASCSGGQG